MLTRSQELKDNEVRAQYTQEFKLAGVRQMPAGQAVSAVAKVLGIPKGRLRAVVSRLRMGRDITKKTAAYFAQDMMRGTLGYSK